MVEISYRENELLAWLLDQINNGDCRLCIKTEDGEVCSLPFIEQLVFDILEDFLEEQNKK